MGSIVARLIPQKIEADVSHEFDADTALAAIEHSINGLIESRKVKDVTPKQIDGRAERPTENVAVLVSSRTKSA